MIYKIHSGIPTCGPIVNQKSMIPYSKLIFETKIEMNSLKEMAGRRHWNGFIS